MDHGISFQEARCTLLIKASTGFFLLAPLNCCKKPCVLWRLQASRTLLVKFLRTRSPQRNALVARSDRHSGRWRCRPWFRRDGASTAAKRLVWGERSRMRIFKIKNMFQTKIKPCKQRSPSSLWWGRHWKPCRWPRWAICGAASWVGWRKRSLRPNSTGVSWGREWLGHGMIQKASMWLWDEGFESSKLLWKVLDEFSGGSDTAYQMFCMGEDNMLRYVKWRIRIRFAEKKIATIFNMACSLTLLFQHSITKLPGRRERVCVCVWANVKNTR